MKKTKLEFEKLFPFKCKSLVAISYERFMSVAFPMRFKMDYRIAYCVCASIWVIAGGIAAPLLTSRIYKVNLLFLFFLPSFYYYHFHKMIMSFDELLLLLFHVRNANGKTSSRLGTSPAIIICPYSKLISNPINFFL